MPGRAKIRALAFCDSASLRSPDIVSAVDQVRFVPNCDIVALLILLAGARLQSV
jgi:hypothetical protein